MTSNKNTMMRSSIIAIFGALFGIGVGVFSLFFYQSHQLLNNPQTHLATPDNDENEPLYWVAPMDDNYRRDAPGKSPMGMDLIPVYRNNDALNAGVITISPNVINNLGVRTAHVEIKALENTISTVGIVQYDQDQLVHIHPRVNGWVEKLYIKASGNPVKKGQALYTLYSPQLVNAQEEYLIALKRNNLSLMRAAKNRLIALQLSSDFINTLDKTQQVQQTVTFYAPQAGVITDLHIREGYFVKPDKTLMSIGKLDQVWVEAEVFERDSALIKKGLKVVMTMGFLPGKQWLGSVDYVYPSLNLQNRTLRLRLKFDNADRQLKPNMFAQLTIKANAIKNAMLVPKEAVIRTGKQNRVVLALGQGQFKSIAVSIGKVDTHYIQILAGLKKGDVVVTSAQFLLDSESSKNSDFKRMHAAFAQASDAPAQKDNIATVNGHINSLNLATRRLNISRQAIEKWHRPAATMDFSVTDEIDLSTFKAGDDITFTFKVNSDFVILKMATNAKPISQENSHLMITQGNNHD